jgi:glycosyltransferase involved in cell wall biosynthesis
MSEVAVSAVVPVYNEREALPVAIARLSETLSAHAPSWEILLVESGSTDGTAELADASAEADPRVRVVHESRRNGFGSAIRLGIANSRGEHIWIVPVDLPFPLATIGTALREDADAVISYRSNDRRSWPRRLQSWVFNTLGRARLGLRIRSINSAFKVYRRDAVARLTLEQRGWLIDAEILYLLSRQGARIVELPVPVIDRELGTSKVGLLDGFAVFVQLWQLKRSGGRT